MSNIEWTDKTWNPTTGCTKISPGCKHCYAEVMARRLKAMGQPNYRNGFDLTIHEHMLDRPLHWRKPRMVFVNSMSDLFHKDVPFAFIDKVFAVMALASQHTFQILTKRADRMAEYFGHHPTKEAHTFARVGALAASIAGGRGEDVADPNWGNFFEWPLRNVWLGTSPEDKERAALRTPDLLLCSAAVHFLSVEPLLERIPNLDLDGIDLVICGGESGPGARPMHPDWARDIRDQCVAADVPFFFKQHGGVNKKKAGRVLDGRTWDEMPGSVKCQQQKTTGRIAE